MIKISLPTLILQWINFMILVWILKRILYKPVLEFLDKRSNQIESDIKENKQLREEAYRLVQQQQKKLIQAKREALEIIENAKQSGNEENDRLIEDAKKRAKAIIENTQKQIEAEIQKQKENLMKEVGSISVLLAERIIKRELKTKDIDRMTNDFIKELGNSN